MRKSFVILAVLIALLLAAFPVFAEEAGHECDHGGATIESLGAAIQHGAAMEHISAQVVPSLLAKVNAAQAAYNRGQAATAANILQALISETNALAGVMIDPVHAEHLAMHTHHVIAALQ